jgi:quercetin dioxygenase-like cupin family protein
MLTLGASAVLLYGGCAQADPSDPPTPITIEVLTPRATFTDDVAIQARLKLDGRGTEVIKAADPSHVVTTRITVQPGAQFPWHTHYGPVFVTVAQGEMTYLSSKDCVGRRYASGTAFVDPGHPVHTAFNSGKIKTVLITTFFEVPEGTAPLSIPAEAPADCKVPTG